MGKKRLSEPRGETASTSIKMMAEIIENNDENPNAIKTKKDAKAQNSEPSNVRFSPNIKYLCLPKFIPKIAATGSETASTVIPSSNNFTFGKAMMAVVIIPKIKKNSPKLTRIFFIPKYEYTPKKRIIANKMNIRNAQYITVSLLVISDKTIKNNARAMCNIFRTISLLIIFSINTLKFMQPHL